MPLIQVSMFEGRDENTRARLVQALTNAAIDALGVAPDRVKIYLHEYDKSHVASGGELYSRKATK